MTENLVIHITVAGRSVADVCSEELLTERRTPKRNQTQGDIVSSYGIVFQEEVWESLKKTSRRWPKEHKVAIGLPGAAAHPRGNKMWPLEDFLEYSFDEACSWLMVEFRPRQALGAR